MPPSTANVTPRPQTTPPAAMLGRAAIAPRPGTSARGRLLPTVLGLALAAGLADHALAQTPSFTIIPQPPGTSQWCQPTGVSSDGRVVCGNVASPGAFVWTAQTGRVDLAGNGEVPSGRMANAISGDGTTIVGGMAAYRYRGPGTYELLGSLGLYTRSFATGVSNDGTVIAGWASDSINDFAEAFRWTPTTGLRSLGLLAGFDTHSQATGVSRDGQTIVGWSRGAGSTRPFEWTEATGMRPLPMPGDSYVGAANAVNFDGSVIVGQVRWPSTPFDPNLHATMWRDGQVIDLGVPAGMTSTQAFAVDDAGDVVVGGATAPAPLGGVGFIWTPGRGMEPFTTFLAAKGFVFPPGYALSCTGVSADGRTFVGGGSSVATGSFGFVATIPSPGLLPVMAIVAAWSQRRRRD